MPARCVSFIDHKSVEEPTRDIEVVANAKGSPTMWPKLNFPRLESIIFLLLYFRSVKDGETEPYVFIKAQKARQSTQKR